MSESGPDTTRKTGILEKFSGGDGLFGRWVKKFATVDERGLTYWPVKRPNDPKTGKTISLIDAIVEPWDTRNQKRITFRVKNAIRDYFFSVETESQREAWVIALKPPPTAPVTADDVTAASSTVPRGAVTPSTSTVGLTSSANKSTVAQTPKRGPTSALSAVLDTATPGQAQPLPQPVPVATPAASATGTVTARSSMTSQSGSIYATQTAGVSAVGEGTAQSDTASQHKVAVPAVPAATATTNGAPQRSDAGAVVPEATAVPGGGNVGSNPVAAPAAPLDTAREIQDSVRALLTDYNSDSPSHTDWNQLYQSLIDAHDNTFESNMTHGIALHVVTGLFVQEAKRVARTVVDEYSLPEQMGSVPRTTTGRSALYIKDKLYVRICEDSDHEFSSAGSDETADVIRMKIAGHDVKSTRAYAGTNVAGLHTGLLCTIDVRGFRVVVLAALPVEGGNTLIFGGPTGVVNDQFDNLLRTAGGRLGLREHEVFLSGDQPFKTTGSAEVQGHHCPDGRSYLCNLALTYPADQPRPGSYDTLVRLLRPEYVHGRDVPLSSDAFCAVAANGAYATQADNDAIVASQELSDITIRDLAASLDALDDVPLTTDELSELLHSRGVNIRYLGVLAEYTQTPMVQLLLEVDMVARTCKHILSKSLRKVARLRQAEQGSFTGTSKGLLAQESKEIVVDFFNLILGQSDESDTYFSSVIVSEVRSMFGYTLGPVRDAIHRPAVYLALQSQCGVQFMYRENLSFQIVAPLSIADFVGFQPRIKTVLSTNLPCTQIVDKWEEYVDTNQYEKALQALHTKLALVTGVQGQTGGEVSQVLRNIAKVHLASGDYGSAQTVLMRALTMVPRMTAPAARLYLDLVEVKFALNDQTGGLSLLYSAKQAVEWHYGPHHHLMLAASTMMGRLYRARGQFSDAIAHLNSGHEAAITALGSQHPVTAYFQSQLGHVWRASGHIEKSIEAYSKALHSYSSLPNQTDSVSYVNFYLGEALYQLGDFERASVHAGTSLQSRREHLGLIHPLTLNSIYQVAHIADASDNERTAVQSYETLISILKQMDDPSVLPELQSLIRSVVRLKLRLLPVDMRILLVELVKAEQIQYVRTGGTDPLQDALGVVYNESASSVIDRLIVAVRDFNRPADRRLMFGVARLLEQSAVTSTGGSAPAMLGALSTGLKPPPLNGSNNDDATSRSLLTGASQAAQEVPIAPTVSGIHPIDGGPPPTHDPYASRKPDPAVEDPRDPSPASDPTVPAGTTIIQGRTNGKRSSIWRRSVKKDEYALKDSWKY